jgi:hypothetical protein
MMSTLYDVSVSADSQYFKRIYDDELEREATVKQYLMVQTEGELEVQRKVDRYSLQAIIAMGFMNHVILDDLAGPLAKLNGAFVFNLGGWQEALGWCLAAGALVLAGEVHQRVRDGDGEQAPFVLALNKAPNFCHPLFLGSRFASPAQGRLGVSVARAQTPGMAGVKSGAFHDLRTP